MLLLVRHGETEANRLGRYLGRADPDLTDRGRSQVEALARWLPPGDLVVSSPLRRARATAAALGPTVEVDDRWIELDYGPLDGQPVGAVAPDVLERWRRDPGFAPTGVETLDELFPRVRSACTDLLERARTSVVVVVTHVSPIKAALAWALDAPPTVADRLFVEDGGVSRIDLDAGRPVVRWFNRTGEEPGHGTEEAGAGPIPRR